MDEFSCSIAEELFDDFPEWRSSSREEEASDGSRYLVVEVPAPKEADTQQGLIVTTYNGEVTVYFDCHHAHFDQWRPDYPNEEYGSAMAFVQSILSERVAIASWWDGETLLCSSQVTNGDLDFVPSDFTRLRVRSWHGLYNKLSSPIEADGSVNDKT